MGSQKRNHTKKHPRTAEVKSLPRDLCQSVLITLGLGALFLLIASLLLSFAADPLPLTRPIGVGIAAVTAFWGGWLTLRIHGRSALLCGLCNGSLCLAVFLLLSLGMKGQAFHSAPISFLLHLGFPLLSVAGAYAGRRSPTKRKKRKTKRP